MERMARGASIVTGNCSDLKSLNVIVVKKKRLSFFSSLCRNRFDETGNREFRVGR